VVENLGPFEGRRLTDGTLAFYPSIPAEGNDSLLSVGGYQPPVTGPPSDWYFYTLHSGKHSGLDVNLRKHPRGDVDLGQPVFSTCSGLVVFAGLGRGWRWGNLVITASLAGGRLLFWRYAHLRDMYVDAGQLIPAGTLIGTIGKGYNDQFAAHLHLDAWRGKMIAPESWLARGVEWVDPLEVWAEAGYEWKWGKK
jgi:murein DD-endopeptidase MepM/ murein hydrolase activator NlpD